MVLLCKRSKWEQQRLEPWDYDPKRSAEMTVDMLGYVGIIAPQKVLQVPCKLLGTRAQYAHMSLMRII